MGMWAIFGQNLAKLNLNNLEWNQNNLICNIKWITQFMLKCLIYARKTSKNGQKWPNLELRFLRIKRDRSKRYPSNFSVG